MTRPTTNIVPSYIRQTTKGIKGLPKNHKMLEKEKEKLKNKIAVHLVNGQPLTACPSLSAKKQVLTMSSALCAMSSALCAMLRGLTLFKIASFLARPIARSTWIRSSAMRHVNSTYRQVNWPLPPSIGGMFIATPLSAKMSSMSKPLSAMMLSPSSN